MAKERRKRRDDVMKTSKPITWHADPKDRNIVDDIKFAEESRDGRPCGVTHILTMAVRVFANLYKENPDQAIEMARKAARQGRAA